MPEPNTLKCKHPDCDGDAVFPSELPRVCNTHGLCTTCRSQNRTVANSQCGNCLKKVWDLAFNSYGVPLSNQLWNAFPNRAVRLLMMDRQFKQIITLEVLDELEKGLDELEKKIEAHFDALQRRIAGLCETSDVMLDTAESVEQTLNDHDQQISQLQGMLSVGPQAETVPDVVARLTQWLGDSLTN